MLARDTSMWTDDVWVVDSTPVECARSRETVKRSDLAEGAEYGYCSSHSRYFWGLRLHLLPFLSRRSANGVWRVEYLDFVGYSVVIVRVEVAMVFGKFFISVRD